MDTAPARAATPKLDPWKVPWRMGPVPSMADAQKVADEFSNDPNVLRVLLFGSVASGEQTRGSDIDLMVIWADLDHYKRQEVGDALCRRAKGVVKCRGEVGVIDLNEWEERAKQDVSETLEARIRRRPLVTLFDRTDLVS